MAYYLMNNSLFTTIEIRTLIEIWSDTSTNYSILKIFGCPAYTHINSNKHEKRAHKCIFFCY